MGRHTTEMSCASLSFDMTLFALARIRFTDETCVIRNGRCPVHPLKKRPIVTDNMALEYTAYVNAFLSYYKLLDNVRDAKGIKKLFWKTAAAFGKTPVKKVPAEYAELGEHIKKCLDTINRYEDEKCPTPSLPADEFGDLLGYALSYGLEDPGRRIAYEFGRKIGRWDYLADAVCDYEDDLKTGSYNPFVYSMSEKEGAEFIKNGAEGVLSSELIDAKNTFILYEGREDECYGCIMNIVTLGMTEAFRECRKKINGDKNAERPL